MRESFEKKTKKVFKAINFAPVAGIRSFNVIERLKAIRDALAHGKPVEEELDKIVEARVGELNGQRVDLSSDWEKLCKSSLVLEAFDDLQQVWTAMRSKAGIREFDAITHGNHGISLIKEL